MKKYKVLFAAIAVALVLAACGPSEESGNSSDATLFVPQDNPVSFNMLEVSDRGSLTAINSVFEGLIDYDGEEFVSSGAESYEVSDDSLVYTFKLREDAVWVDSAGEEVGKVTAEDYVYSWQMMADPENGAAYGYIFAGIVKNGTQIQNGEVPATELGVKAVDEYTLEVTTEVALPYVLDVFAYPALKPFSKAAVEEFGEDYGMTPETTYYNGPYTITEFVVDNKLVMERNKNYWDVDNVYYKTIDSSLVSDNSVLFNAYKNDELDVVGVGNDALLKEVQNDEELSEQYSRSPRAGNFYLVMNTRKENMKDENLRLAMLNGFDVETYVNDITGGTSYVPEGFVPAGLTTGGFGVEYRDYAGVDFTANDDTKAQEYADKATHKSFTLLTFDTENNLTLAQFIQEEFKQLGIEVKLDVQPSDSFWGKLDAGDFEVSTLGWGADWGDPGNFLTSIFHSKQLGLTNYGYDDPELDKLLDAAEAETDTDARFEAFAAAEDYVFSKGYVVPLTWGAFSRLVKPGVHAPIHSFIRIPYKYYYSE